MASERTLIAAQEGVELWQTNLIADGSVVNSAFVLKSLRTPECPAYASEVEARRAFEEEVKLSADSPIAQHRLAR
ncbi:hypothetical protein DM806_23990 [Sphingobium lactosutens]|uniref:hypothetical protein n=1 Tax=Sphingobium lactosutens TaxID=522773 RepID=UPI0015BDA60B|nr:hypothetical protein [Sphingobium lactosutens]NWK98667.1 hypothetical protein [Sphingobium lactosutens]